MDTPKIISTSPDYVFGAKAGHNVLVPKSSLNPFSDSQAAGLQSMVSDAGITSATVDGSGRPTSVTKGSASYTITYPSATSVQITDGASFLRQITLDANGRFASMV